MNFAAGDHLLWLETAKNLQSHKSNPITFDFGTTTVQGGGAQIGSAVYGSFVARVEAFNASGASLASFTETGNALNTNGDNSAIFIGVRSDTANISRIALSIDSAPLNNTAHFVINRFDFRSAGVASATSAATGTNSLSAPQPASSDSVYIGDNSDNSVKQFDAKTGAYLGALVASGSGGLNGPRGLIFRNNGQLLVVDQNVNEPNPGEILRFNGVSGTSLGNLVFQTDPHAPFAPRGMVLGAHHVLYVADDGNLDGIILGRLTRFDSETGAFLGDLQPTGFTGDFYPRGVVVGPDGLVYASVRNIAPTGGEIMRWDPVTGNFLGSFVTGDATNDLNRPEGIAFGPDGNLYVASFRADALDTDKVEEFSGTTGAYLGKIDLDQVGQPRAFAQALLFGPGGKLFVPITGNGPDTGAVRRYDVSTKTFDVFISSSDSGGPLGQPWYLTLGHTDPATLAYQAGAKTVSQTAAVTQAASSDQSLIGPMVDQALTEFDLFHPRRRSVR
jgi:hypothetical protein